MSVSTIVLIVANLLPLVGVVFWGWDAFVLLILYWLETAVIGFWTVVRILILSPADVSALGFRSTGPGAGPIGRVGTAMFLTLHAGIFMAVHFLFLWALFSGDWSRQVHNPGDFILLIVIGTGLWAPLLVLFFVRGWIALRPAILARLPFIPVVQSRPGEEGATIILGLYLRIVVMQVAIIFGGWVAMLSGASIGALALLIVGKTLAELYFGPIAHHASVGALKAAAERDGSL